MSSYKRLSQFSWDSRKKQWFLEIHSRKIWQGCFKGELRLEVCGPRTRSPDFNLWAMDTWGWWFISEVAVKQTLVWEEQVCLCYSDIFTCKTPAGSHTSTGTSWGIHKVKKNGKALEEATSASPISSGFFITLSLTQTSLRCSMC